ncbi:MAG: type II toxin-antitoxin system HicA family toxin [Bradyrhizobium sp.]|nr:type II toxin-antitoxin system HicA family toxin [Bradyrhizobium sp.]
MLSGAEVTAILGKFGFIVVGHAGSHAKLRRITPYGPQMLIVPIHKEIPRGTLRGIFGQATRFIPQADLHPHFYTSAN